MSDFHPKTPIEIAAQLWCLPEHAAKEMDVSFAESIAKAIQSERELSDALYEMARQHCDSSNYYRGLVTQIGKLFGDDAYLSDDGSRQQDVLCAKVPDLVKALIEESKKPTSPPHLRIII